MSEETTEAPPASGPEATIHQRMIAIIDELPAIGKSQYNEQQKFHFRGHDDVLNALTPLLSKHGVTIVPHVLERVTDQRTTRQGAVMYEVNLHIEYTFYGAAGDSITGSAWGEGTDMGDKATMKAGTMAFKAMLNQAFAINTEEGAKHDTDKGTVEETVKPEENVEYANEEDVEKFLTDMTEAGFDREAYVRATLDPHRAQWEGVRQDWLDGQRRDLQNAIAKARSEA